MRRLGKQRVEAYQILRSLCGISDGWKNHPATKMWRGYEGALEVYMAVCIVEWRSRGHRDTCWEKWKEQSNGIVLPNDDPPWLGDQRLHSSHRSNLLRKNVDHYGQFGWDEPDDLPYFWPTEHEEYRK